jgi:hypothetical protein
MIIYANKRKKNHKWKQTELNHEVNYKTNWYWMIKLKNMIKKIKKLGQPALTH